jgi:hypothetical protein
MSLRTEEQYTKLENSIRNIIQMLPENSTPRTQILRARDQQTDIGQVWKYEQKRGALAQRRAAWIDDDAEKRRKLVEISLLESLKFPMILYRMESIAKAHQDTFQWIFKEPEAIHKPWDSFIRWLRNDGGLYWINGKAASGKSTLMKFISYHPTTMENLNIWLSNSEDTRQLLLGRYFFWNSGIPEQRSQTGLLRSLLYEMLSVQKDLIPEVFPSEWEDKCSLVSHGLGIYFEAWSLSRLEGAFRTLTALASTSRKFCFFIDGLDEFEGDHSRMGILFSDLASSPNVKFCVSSRPWPVFETTFKETPQLRLQDLTFDDIKTYVTKELLETMHMQQLIKEEPEDTGAHNLVDDVVAKAAGVFLWIVLVVRSLLAGLENGDGVKHLQRRLDHLPADLEDLYENMLDSIEGIYLEQSSQIFQIFRAADYNLTIPVLNGALDATFEEAMVNFKWPRDIEELKLRRTKWLSRHRRGYAQYERMQSQLNSRTKGLLEVDSFKSPNKSEDSFIKDEDKVKFPSITYLHRTARDYLESPKVWSALVRHTRTTQPEPKSALFMYHLIEAKNKNAIDEAYMKEKARVLIEIAQHLDESSSNVRTTLIDELDRMFTHVSTLGGSRAYFEHWSNGLLEGISSNIWSLSFAYGLHWYIASKLKAKPDVALYAMRHLDSVIGEDHSGEQPVLPLLGYALSLHRWAAPGGCVPDVQFVEVLLKHSADPNHRHMGHTLWQYTLEYLYLASHNSHTDANLTAVWPQTIRLLLQYGADPYAHCIGDYNIWTRGFDSIEKTEWGTQASSWIVYSHVQQQDATSVLRTVFRSLTSMEMGILIDLLEEKKASQASMQQYS